jgi:hypothetical protein
MSAIIKVDSDAEDKREASSSSTMHVEAGLAGSQPSSKGDFLDIPGAVSDACCQSIEYLSHKNFVS